MYCCETEEEEVPYNIGVDLGSTCVCNCGDYNNLIAELDRDVKEDFMSNKCNFEHCQCALDRKHIAINALHKSGSIYYNYNGSFPITTLAHVDVDYRFTCVDIVVNDSTSPAPTGFDLIL